MNYSDILHQLCPWLSKLILLFSCSLLSNGLKGMLGYTLAMGKRRLKQRHIFSFGWSKASLIQGVNAQQQGWMPLKLLTTLPSFISFSPVNTRGQIQGIGYCGAADGLHIYILLANASFLAFGMRPLTKTVCLRSS